MLINMLILCCPDKSNLIRSNKKIQPASKIGSITIKDLFIGDENSVENANKEFISILEKNNLFYRNIIAALIINGEPFNDKFGYKQIENKIEEAVKSDNIQGFISSIFDDKEDRVKVINRIALVISFFTKDNPGLVKRYINIIADKLGGDKEATDISELIRSNANEDNIEFLINTLLLILKELNLNLRTYKHTESNDFKFEIDFPILKTNFSTKSAWEGHINRFLIDVALAVAENNDVTLPHEE